jgi:hypothetical protein
MAQVCRLVGALDEEHGVSFPAPTPGGRGTIGRDVLYAAACGPPQDEAIGDLGRPLHAVDRVEHHTADLIVAGDYPV